MAKVTRGAGTAGIRTCRMISGEVVLPNTPTVTGYSSYDPCACRATTPAPSAN